MAAQIALLFARRLQVPVVLTDLDQARVDAGVGYAHAEIDKQLSRGRPVGRRRQPAEGAGHRVGRQGRVRRRGLRHRGGLRGARGPSGRVFAEVEAVVLRYLRARHEHLLAVGHRDGGRPGPPGSGWSASTSSTRSRCCRWSRWCAAQAGRVTRRSATALAVGRELKKNCVIVADRPAFVGRNRVLTPGFLGEITRAVDEGTPFEVARARPPTPRPADDPVPAAAAGRAADRAARGADPARGARRPLRRVPEKLRALAESGKSSVYRRLLARPRGPRAAQRR